MLVKVNGAELHTISRWMQQSQTVAEHAKIPTQAPV